MTAQRRRILISGGTSGIGLATAERLTRQHDVWVIGTSEESVGRAVSLLSLAGGSALDVADGDAVDRAFAAAAGAMGGIDGVFVNAGIDGQAVPAVDLDVERMRRLLDVNVVGAFLVARAAVRIMERPGTIVLNASANALRPEVDFLDYNVSKAAVLSIAKSLALEVSREGISVITLCPGYFPTRMTEPYLSDPAILEGILSIIPAGRLGELTEAAAVVDFLLGPEARYLTGSVISLDGGRTI
jgi:NAD(P)-dependent dehydrogenase (short-subunit alcohol dehydrogenase family)